MDLISCRLLVDMHDMANRGDAALLRALHPHPPPRTDIPSLFGNVCRIVLRYILVCSVAWLQYRIS